MYMHIYLHVLVLPVAFIHRTRRDVPTAWEIKVRTQRGKRKATNIATEPTNKKTKPKAAHK